MSDASKASEAPSRGSVIVKRQPMPAPPSRPASSATDKAIAAARDAEQALTESIRLQASKHIPDAIETLAALAKGECIGDIDKLTSSTVRSAARDILELSGGRPETRDPRTSDPSQQVHIYIQKFGGPEPEFIPVVNEYVEGPAEEPMVSESIAQEYEVDDAEAEVA